MVIFSYTAVLFFCFYLIPLIPSIANTHRNVILWIRHVLPPTPSSKIYANKNILRSSKTVHIFCIPTPATSSGTTTMIYIHIILSTSIQFINNNK